MRSWLMLPVLCIFTFCHQADRTPGNLVWYTQLPDCPCRNPDEKGIRLHDGWAIDKGEIQVYHSGAQICFRSYPAVKTSEGWSGQQCCYDSDAVLVRSGTGAGTPDKVSTCSGEDAQGMMKLRLWGLAGHFWKDVRPWKRAGSPAEAWKSYNLTWVPNQGNGCAQ